MKRDPRGQIVVTPLSFRPLTSERSERLYRLSVVKDMPQADVLRLAVDEMYERHIEEIETREPAYRAVRDAEDALEKARQAAAELRE